MRTRRCLAPPAPTLALLPLALLPWLSAAAQQRVLDGRAHHLRSGASAEWRDSAGHPHARHLAVEFAATAANATEQTLVLRQEDVKQRWRLLVNGRDVGTLHQDENPLVAYWAVPAGTIAAGRNSLRVERADTAGADDIWVGGIELLDRPLEAVLSQATVEVEVVDAASGEPLPARVTIADARGRLQTVGAASGGMLAVRPGVVYTGSGRAEFGAPAGSYRIFASRGFEYGADSARLVLRPGDRVRRRLVVRREVPTPGWVGSDTHVHTGTYSGHGDATAEERVIAIAGEGIELPIITDHNVHVDLDSVATAVGVRAHFTPVVGNEVTTRVGHFNIFPVARGTPPPDPRAESWSALFQEIEAAGARGIILNHGRDIHAGFRPFGAERHVAVVGVSRDGWVLRANAMELVNSGSQQLELRRLFADWFGMLNRGHLLTPVGSSDSHDVSRYVVGQARTYIRARDDTPGRIDVDEAVERFRAGAVMVSFGLLAELTVGGAEKHGPGDLAPAADPLVVSVRVLGPAWARAERVSLFANGREIRGARIARGRAPGVKWSGSWRLPRPAHDVHLVAIADGPGEPRLPFWPIARPYQRASPEWSPRVVGVSGAVWVDADGDGQRTDAHAYASRLVAASAGAIGPLLRSLAPYDEAVAAQAAALLLDRGVPPAHAELAAALQRAAPATRRGFAAFAGEWQASEAAGARAARPGR